MTDEFMNTSDPNIHAVGDVVQTHNCITGHNVNLALAGVFTHLFFIFYFLVACVFFCFFLKKHFLVCTKQMFQKLQKKNFVFFVNLTQ